MLTALIGDFASHVGCTIGLKDTITAIGFVALGTSVPGNKGVVDLHPSNTEKNLYS